MTATYRGNSLVVTLESGAVVTVTIDHWLSLHPNERDAVYRLMNAAREFAKKYDTPSPAPAAPNKET